jgi:hypothetical protein
MLVKVGLALTNKGSLLLRHRSKTATSTLYLTPCYIRASRTMFDIFLTKGVLPQADRVVVAIAKGQRSVPPSLEPTVENAGR